MSELIKNLLIWTVIAVVLMSLFSGIGGRNVASEEYNYSEFMQQVQTGQVESVVISGREMKSYWGVDHKIISSAHRERCIISKLEFEQNSIAKSLSLTASIEFFDTLSKPNIEAT